MSRILITGMNRNQCVKDFYLRQQLKVIPSHYSLIRCLEDMGHEVTQASFADVAEEDFDEVIVFLAGHRQMVAVEFYNGLNAIAKYPNCILAFDDWQTREILAGFAKCEADENELYNAFTQRTAGETDPHPDHTAAVKQIMSKTNRVLLSVFAGGEINKLIDWPEDLLYGYNPNPYHHNRKPGDRWNIPISEMAPLEVFDLPSAEEDKVSFEDKEEKFNFASLVQSSTRGWLKKTQKIENWEVEFFGSRKDGQRRLHEGDMCRVYGEQWGCLMPGYKHSGSGWWRARPLQVADQLSILVGDPEEMMIYYGTPELANVTAGDVEKMSFDDRVDFAWNQHKAIMIRHPLHHHVQRNELENVLHGKV